MYIFSVFWFGNWDLLTRQNNMDNDQPHGDKEVLLSDKLLAEDLDEELDLDDLPV